jgi:hypothetical protein
MSIFFFNSFAPINAILTHILFRIGPSGNRHDSEDPIRQPIDRPDPYEIIGDTRPCRGLVDLNSQLGYKGWSPGWSRPRL